MDVNMPVMDGLEATKQLCKIIDECKLGKLLSDEGNVIKWKEEIPIVALTANDTQMERKKCQEAGMTKFLSKPPEIQQL